MPHSDMTGQRIECFLVEDLCNETHFLDDKNAIAIRDCDTSRFLTAMLQCVEAEIRKSRDIFTRCPDSHNAAGILGRLVLIEEVVGQQTITAWHLPKPTLHHTTEPMTARCVPRQMRDQRRDEWPARSAPPR